MVLRAAVVVCALLAAWPALADDSKPTEVAAAWKKHEVDFLYMGFTTRYSCGGLKSKVKLLLKHLGVREDVKILERGCEFGYQHVADFPRLKLTFYAPYVPQEGDRDVGEPVLGVWKAVTIKRNSPRGLEMGDCEMVELFRDRILPFFVTRGIEGDVSCIPHQLVGNRMDLRFEVLTGIKSVDTDAQAKNQDR
ncbi:MAG: hypothetical protein ACREVI_07275 [Steroidobacteraceae bacterium]